MYSSMCSNLRSAPLQVKNWSGIQICAPVFALVYALICSPVCAPGLNIGAEIWTLKVNFALQFAKFERCYLILSINIERFIEFCFQVDRRSGRIGTYDSSIGVEKRRIWGSFERFATYQNGFRKGNQRQTKYFGLWPRSCPEATWSISIDQSTLRIQEIIVL